MVRLTATEAVITGRDAQAVVPVPRLPGIEPADALIRLAHRVSPEEAASWLGTRGLRGVLRCPVPRGDPDRPRTGSPPSVRGYVVITHRSPAGHWPGDAPAPAPGGQPVPQNPRAVTGCGCPAPVPPRQARYPAYHRPHPLTHLEAANAGLTGHGRALCGRRIPATGLALRGPSAGLCLTCVPAGTTR